jgi:hypothetical protein
MSSKHKGEHIWATDSMRKRCPKCGTWRVVKYVCNFEGCKAKKTDVNMCKCTKDALR